MFCPLESVELTVSSCPVRKCAYKKPNGQCGHAELTEDNVDVKTIAEVKSEKVYKVKASVGRATRNIKIGLMTDSYAEYVKSSFPRVAKEEGEAFETVNTIDSHVSRVLREVFGLADNQQQKFWSEPRYTSWATTTGSAFTLSDIRESLADIKL